MKTLVRIGMYVALATQGLSATGYGENAATFEIAAWDPSDANPVSVVAKGATFQLHVLVEDTSTEPAGIIQAFLNVYFNGARIRPTGQQQGGSDFLPTTAESELSASTNVLWEIGAVTHLPNADSIPPDASTATPLLVPLGNRHLMSVEMEAINYGYTHLMATPTSGTETNGGLPASASVTFFQPPEFNEEGFVAPSIAWDFNSVFVALGGDANLDGIVNASDLSQLGQNWELNNSPGWEGGDFNGDGNVDAADLDILGDNWQQTASY